MEYFLIPFTALLGSFLTFFSGFGLGTILLPVFAIYFSLPEAILMTALVHFVNNLAKFRLLYKMIDLEVALVFGTPALIAAFAGAELLAKIYIIDVPFEYSLMDNVYAIYPLKLLIGVLMIVFALFELLPVLKNLQFEKRFLAFGGVLSGFFGGLSGHQGALRSAFLVRANLSSGQFIATGVSIALLVDLSRLGSYFSMSSSMFDFTNTAKVILIILSTIFAIMGAFIGKRFIAKVKIAAIQNIVGLFLIIFGVLIMFGII